MVSTRKRRLPSVEETSKSDTKRSKRGKENSKFTDIKNERIKEEEETLSSDNEPEEATQTKAMTLAEKMKARLQENEKFLADLNISSAKADVAEVADIKPYKPTARGYKESSGSKKKEILPPRKSLRLQNITPDGVQLPDKPPISYFTPEPFSRNQHVRVEGDIDMLKNIRNDVDESNHSKFIVALGSLPESKAKTSPELKKFLKEFDKMSISEERVAKVTKDRIFSVAIHPTEEKVLAIAGDKWGKLGFWDVGAKDEDGVYFYEPHCRPIKQITIPSLRPDRLYSCSYDGMLKCCHFEKGIFEEVYSTPEEDDILLTGFDFLSADTMLVSQWNGAVARIDTREGAVKAEEHHICHKQVRSVSIHPVNQNDVATAHQNGDVKIWDLRKWTSKNNTSLKVLPHSRVVESAFFSPLTGKYLLTTALDDKVRIFNADEVQNGKVKLKKSVHHNNWTGRWLSKFRATWHPSREDLFVIGSMKHPRQIEVFSDEGELVKTFKDPDHLGSVCSLNSFHPTRNVIVGGNSSGRLHVFM